MTLHLRRPNLAGLSAASLVACLGVGVTATAFPAHIAAQTKRVALGMSLTDENGTSARLLLLAVPVRSIAHVGARWGFGPVLGIGSVANPGRRQDVEFAEVGLRVARVFSLKGVPRPLAGDDESVGLAVSLGMGGASPYDTASVSLPPGAEVGRRTTWIPTARVELLLGTRVGGRGTPAVATVAFGRVFRRSDAAVALGLETRWYTAFGLEVATR